MSRLQDLIRRDTRANQPAATAVPIGTLYYVTDEAKTERSSGSAWQDCSDSGGGGGSGVVVQVKNLITGAVATGSTVIPLDDTIPQNTEGDEYMTLSITPTSTSNKLKIEVVAFLTSLAANWLIAALFKDSDANALAAFANYQTVATAGCPVSFTHYMTAPSTSAITFKVRCGRDASAGSTITFNGQSSARKFGGVMASSITISEIVP